MGALYVISHNVVVFRFTLGSCGGLGGLRTTLATAIVAITKLRVRDDEGVQQRPGKRRDQKRRIARGKAPWRLEKAFHEDLLSMGQSIAALCVGHVNIN